MGENVSTFSKKIGYQFSRFRKFIGTFMKKKMGIAGTIIIGIFVFISIFAPFLAKYDPIRDKGLASARAAPSWLRYVPSYLGGNPMLTENFDLISNPDFNSNQSLQEWQIEANSSLLTYEYVEDFGYSNSIGSIRFSYVRDESTSPVNSTVIFCKKVTFPYTGPPGGFAGRIAIFMNGTNYETWVFKRFINETTGEPYTLNVSAAYFYVPVKIELFMGYVGDVNWTIWPIPSLSVTGLTSDNVALEYTGKWISSGSINHAITQLNDMFRNKTGQDAPSTLFGGKSFPGDYFIGVKITFLDSDANAGKYVKTEFYIDDFGMRFLGTSWGLLGTDQHGRDIFSQLIYGSRLSIYVGLLSAFISVFLGLIVGLLAGYLGRIVDEILMRFTDMLLVIPTLPLLIVISAVLGPSLENLILLIGFLGWMSFARLVRSQVLTLKERPFVEAARAAGGGRLHILTAHILPNVASLVYVSLATAVPGAIVSEAALAFLGFTDPWRLSWGKMLSDAQESAAWKNWWWVIPPGLCIAALSMAFIFLGYALDEVLNPKLRIRR
ncbi:MAG: ABC transporter permease subunit [Candidatus Bathyarchaeales archaeon]